MWDREFDRKELYYSSLREAREEAWEEVAQKERIQFAKRLLLKSMSDNDIAELTTLPVSLVEQLHSQLVAGF
ncbi:TPA: hypothetical protein ACGOW9_001370 [Streptococcus suis]